MNEEFKKLLFKSSTYVWFPYNYFMKNKRKKKYNMNSTGLTSFGDFVPPCGKKFFNAALM